MKETISETATIDLTSGELVFKESGFILTKGMLLTELKMCFREIRYRDTDEWDPINGLKTTNPNWEPGKNGFVYFEKPIDIEGMLFHLTADISDHAINFIAMKSLNQLCDRRLGPDWDGEKMIRQIHQEWLSKHLKASAKSSKEAWFFKWGRIIDYYDEIQWGAAIWIVQD